MPEKPLKAGGRYHVTYYKSLRKEKEDKKTITAIFVKSSEGATLWELKNHYRYIHIRPDLFIRASRVG